MAGRIDAPWTSGGSGHSWGGAGRGVSDSVAYFGLKKVINA